MLRWLKTLAGIRDPLIVAAKANRSKEFFDILQDRSIVLLGAPDGRGALEASDTDEKLLEDIKNEINTYQPDSPFHPLIVDGDDGPEMLGFLTSKDAENYLRVMVEKLGKIVVLPIASIKGRAIHANMKEGIALVLQAGTPDTVTIRLTPMIDGELNQNKS
jgi:hypothetical protein